MEHLPPVVNPYKPIFIPFLADHNADSFDFSDFHNPRGLNVNLLLQGELQGFSPEQIASFLQTWLYFGMIREILHTDIQMDDFVRTDESGKWITTQKLPEYMQAFRERVEEERLEENMKEIFQVRNVRIRNCFSVARSYWLALADLENNPLPEEAYFGIHVMANTLQVGATEICGLGRCYIYPLETASQPGYRVVPWENDMHWRITPDAFMEKRMKELNWCPVVSDQMQKSCNLLGQYYISLFQPPVRQLDHSQCTKSDKDCKGYWGFAGFDKHLIPGCQCDTVEVDSVHLAEIVEKDEVPVLCFDEYTKTLDVISSKSQPDLEYVALSHVWSDGWGNPQKNSLSLCRIKQLVTWMKASYSIPDFKTQKEVGNFQRLSDFQMQSCSGRWQRASSYSLPSSDGSWVPAPDRGHVGKLYFWMDTLCVPRTPKDIHNKAVMSMRHVYAEAERVLVLDAEFLASSARASYEEVNMRIQSSRWIRRLWTAQEAVLAKRLLFQFKEESIITSTGSLRWEERQVDLRTNYYNSIGWDCYTSFTHYLTLKTPASRIKYIWAEILSSRSVTMASDEPICGAILMDFDLRYILGTLPKDESQSDEDHEVVTEAEAHERMRRFWELHTSGLPVPILFVPGAKLPIAGFTWAPASLMPCEKTGPGTELTGAISKSWVSDDIWGGRPRWILNSLLRIPLAPTVGLTVQLPPRKAFVLPPPPACDEPVKNFLVCELDGQKYFIRPGVDTLDFSGAAAILARAKQLAVIVELLPKELDSPVEDTGAGKGSRWGFPATRAALLVVQRRGWFTWTAQYVRLVSVVLDGSDYFKYPRIPYTEADREEMRRPALKASWRTKEERWYLV